MTKEFFSRIVFGRKLRGCRVDPVTRQSVQTAKHTGDIVYKLKGDGVVSNKSEYKLLTRERTLNPIGEPVLNEVGENKNIIKRTANSRYVKL